MSLILDDVTTQVLTRLGDLDEQVWTQAKIQGFLREGYDRLALMTHCFWDREPLDDVAGQATYEIPEYVYEIERATWDSRKIPALTSEDLIRLDNQFLSSEGMVDAYSIDLDGLRTLRKFKIPAESAGGAAHEVSSWGIPRDVSDLTTESETDQWGIPRTLGESLQSSGSPWGIPRAIANAAQNTEIEFTRRGAQLTTGTSEFEFADHAVKYVRHWAMHRALMMEGPGQDPALAEHYLGRFNQGAARLIRRKQRFHAPEPLQFGGAVGRKTRRHGPVLGPEFPVEARLRR